jgi:hypothetical protein
VVTVAVLYADVDEVVDEREGVGGKRVGGERGWSE